MAASAVKVPFKRAVAALHQVGRAFNTPSAAANLANTVPSGPAGMS